MLVEITAVQSKQPQELKAVAAAALCCVWKAEGRKVSDLLCLNLLVFKVIVNTVCAEMQILIAFLPKNI